MNKYFGDTNQTKLDHILKVYDLPNIVNVKEASVPRSIRSEDFAYPEKERYPINTPLNTTLSYCYAQQDKNMDPDCKARVHMKIASALSFWGLDAPKEIDEAEIDESYKIKIASDNGPLEYKIHEPAELKAATNYILKNASTLTYAVRNKLANSILEAPKELQAMLDLDDIRFLQKTAAEMFCSKDAIKEACEKRAIQIQYDDADIAKTIRQFGAIERKTLGQDEVIKIASFLDYADRATGMNKLYGGVLNPPELSFDGLPRVDIEAFVSEVIPIKNGSAITHQAVVDNREEIVDFFQKIAGEDYSQDSNNVIIARLVDMSLIESKALQELTSVCL